MKLNIFYYSLLFLLAISSCKCRIVKLEDTRNTQGSYKKRKSKLNNEVIASEKKTRIFLGGNVPCYINDNKQIVCEKNIKDNSYDESELERINSHNLVTFASDSFSLFAPLCAIDEYGLLLCTGINKYQKENAQNLERIFENFYLSKMAASWAVGIACGYDVHTKLFHCLSFKEGLCNVDESPFTKLDIQPFSAKDVVLGFTSIIKITSDDVVTSFNVCTKEEEVLFSGDKNIKELYYSPYNGEIICILNESGLANCRQQDNQYIVALDVIKKLKNRKIQKLSFGSYFVCGIEMNTQKGFCESLHSKPQNYDEDFSLPDEILLDIVVGPHSVMWQTASGAIFWQKIFN